MAKTNREVKIEFQLEELIVPKGTPITHQTACGIDKDYNFVATLHWLPEDQEHLRHDLTYRGLNIPRKYVQESDASDIFMGAKDQDTRTELFHAWMKEQDDDIKMRYKLNWLLPHSVFNVSAQLFDSDLIQGINWFEIHKTKDLGEFSNGNKVVI